MQWHKVGKKIIVTDQLKWTVFFLIFLISLSFNFETIACALANDKWTTEEMQGDATY